MAVSKLKKTPAANKAPKPSKPLKSAGEAEATPLKTTKRDKISVGSTVEFVGYADDNEGSFSPGDLLYVLEIEGGKDDKLYSVIPASEVDRYQEDEASVDGEQLVAAEFKAFTGSKTLSMRKEEATLPAFVAVGEMKKYLKGDLIEQAQKLDGSAAKSLFYLGGVLSAIYRNRDLWARNGATSGKSGWKEFCEENFGFGNRKADYCINIYHAYSAIPNFDVSRLADVQWSKVAKLASYVTADNYEELLDLAASDGMTYLKLDAVLLSDYTTDGKTPSGKTATRDSGKVAVTRFNFTLYEGNAGVVQDILEAAKAHYGTEDLNEVFLNIITDFGKEILYGEQEDTESTSKKSALRQAA